MRRTLATIAAFLFVMTLSIAAFAENISKNVTIPNNVQVSGQNLPAGQYKVKVETTGSTAQVHFLKGNKEVVSAPAQVQTLERKQYDTAVEVNHATSSPQLDGIFFSGTTTAVRFNATSASAGE
jgi:hypothetical protein